MKSRMLAMIFLFCTIPAFTVANQTPATSQTGSPTKTRSASSAKTGEPLSKPASAIDPAKEAAIRRLFDVGGAKDSMKQVIAGMTNNMKPALESSLPPGEYRERLIELFLERFMAKISLDQMLEMAIPVYDKYFSLEDIDGLTKFYQTPLGKKAISVLPQVLLETQSAGAKLGEQIGRASMLEVLAEHPDLKKSLEDASSSTNP
jgi:uncharacterized protein